MLALLPESACACKELHRRAFSLKGIEVETKEENQDKDLIGHYVDLKIDTFMNYWKELTREESDFALTCYAMRHLISGNKDKSQSSAIVAAIGASIVIASTLANDNYNGILKGISLCYLGMMCVLVVCTMSSISFLKTCWDKLSKEDLDEIDMKLIIESIYVLVSIRPPSVSTNSFRMFSFFVFLPLFVYCGYRGEYLISGICLFIGLGYSFCVNEHKNLSVSFIKWAYSQIVGPRNSEWLGLTSRGLRL
jgi:hypothetical protein